MYKTREEVENWLKEMKINNYVINEDLTVDIKGDVNLISKGLSQIPIQFGIIDGSFNCSWNNLTSLEGCPQLIGSSFYCSRNELTSLEGCTQKIHGGFYCSDNKLTSLKYCPEIIVEDFDCQNNNLTSFKYFPKEIKGKYVCTCGNNIKEEELVNFNCKMENINKIYSDFNTDRNVEEFLNKVSYYKNIKKENELLKELSIASSNVKLNKKL